jgi:hypothetical protein
VAEKTLTLKIKAAPTADTKKSLDNLQKVATNWDKIFGKDGDKPVKNQVRQVQSLTRAWGDLGKAIKLARDNFKGGFEAGSKSLSGVKAFTNGIEGATKKVLNLKNAIAATAIGGAAIWGIKAIFEQGTGQQRNLARVRREFGDEAGQFINLGNRVGLRSGIQGDDAAAALVPLGEQLQAIQAGARFRGMKGPLNEKQAAALRAKNLTFGAGILERIQTLSPDIDSETLGRVLGDSLAGPEGIKSLISTLHLSRRSKVLSAANEKGEAFSALTPAEQKRLGVTKKGQFLEQGDLVNLLLERSGMTEGAAKDMRKTFGFQSKSVQSQLMDTVGDIGAGALDALNAKLGKGATLAESLHDYLSSEDGKKTIDGITNGVVKITESVVDLAKQLPAIGSWLKEHKTLIGVLAGGYGIAKIAPTAAGIIKGASSMISGARGATPLTPLFVNVVNGAAGSAGSAGSGAVGLLKRGVLGIGGIAAAGGVGAGLLLAGAGAAAAYGGNKAGNYLGKHVAPIGKMHNAEANFLYNLTGEGAADDKVSNFEIGRNQQQLAAKMAKRNAMIAALERSGVDHGHAVLYADRPDLGMQANPALAGILGGGGKPIEITSTTNLVVDGQVLAKSIERHQVKAMENRTGRGAAPVSKQ